MSEQSLNGLMDVTLQRIRELVDSNTIIGEAITMADGTFILPVSKVTYGFVSGGSDVGAKVTKDMFGGGSGAGISISPVAFLVIQEGNVKMLQLADKNNSIDRVIGMMPEMVDKVQGIVSNVTGKKKDDVK